MRKQVCHIIVSLMICIYCSGCLVVYNGTKVLRKNEKRKVVEFESEQASQLFHEKLNKKLCSCTDRTMESEQLIIPFIVATNTSMKLSENACYNDALQMCDSNGDDFISESEAKIYSQI